MGKRRITNSSRATVSKRIKRSSNSNPDDDAEEIYDPNTLIAMPDHVIEKIFDSLDLVDKKSFSESCKKFNEVFSCRKNLDKIWLNVSEWRDANLKKSSRRYSKLQWDCIKGKIPIRLLNDLLSSLTSLKMANDDRVYRYSNETKSLKSASSFFSLLPHFNNLTHLDMIISGDFLENILTSKKRKSELVEIENLSYLRIGRGLFCYLDGRHINFNGTKKLQTFIFHWDYDYDMKLRTLNLNKIRSFILSQKDLKTLHLFDGEVISYIFDLQLNIQSKLEEFKLHRKSLYFYVMRNVNRSNNFFDFIYGQDQLKRLECGFNIDEEKTEKMKRFLKERLDMKLETQTIELCSDRYYLRNSNNFCVEDLVQCADHPNLTTEELELKIDVLYAELSQMLSQTSVIVSKFPNLKSIKIYLDWYIYNSNLETQSVDIFAALSNLKNLKSIKFFLKRCRYSTSSFEVESDIVDNFAALSNFQNLKSLELSNVSSDHLKSITIPKLKRFYYSFSGYQELALTDLVEFLSRHENIQELELDIKGNDFLKTEHGKTSFKNMVEFAIKNLKDLLFFSFLNRFAQYKFNEPAPSLIPIIQEHSKPESF